MCMYEVGEQPEETAHLFVFPQEAWLLSRERELKDELRRERDKEIELAIWTLEEETSKDKEECERAADNRCVYTVYSVMKRMWCTLSTYNIDLCRCKSLLGYQ